ncbi:MAG: hypothetical protein IJ080_04585 [Oscillospiraceae bacterium]|nr:hypothetical protein [Oscillospiraceae bacterium]MBQ8979025.1 hypothetical protein [Oscillospiraceae bacterium]
MDEKNKAELMYLNPIGCRHRLPKKGAVKKRHNIKKKAADHQKIGDSSLFCGIIN